METRAIEEGRKKLIRLLIVDSRLARRGGVKRISVPVYEEMRAAMKRYLEEVRQELYSCRGEGAEMLMVYRSFAIACFMWRAGSAKL